MIYRVTYEFEGIKYKRTAYTHLPLEEIRTALCREYLKVNHRGISSKSTPEEIEKILEGGIPRAMPSLTVHSIEYVEGYHLK